MKVTRELYECHLCCRRSTRSSRPTSRRVLAAGTDQLAIACAFITDGGVEALRPHAQRLRLPRSYIVIAWEPPTTPEVVNRLHDLCPGNVYVHLGVRTPYEVRLGRALMHSKVFLASGGNGCLLWTGSHNLTASAMVGANCEAAIVLQGFADEAPFQAAREHLERCRQEAIRYDPLNPPDPPGGGTATLIIHAEAHVEPKVPRWFVHFRPASTAYDTLIRSGAAGVAICVCPGSFERAGQAGTDRRLLGDDDWREHDLLQSSDWN